MKRRAFWLRASRASRAAAAALMVMFVLAPTGCEDEKAKSSPNNAGDAGIEDSGSNKALLGGKLGAAVAAVEAPPGSAAPASKAGDPRSAGEGAPPENGVFGPAAAEKAHPRGTPAKIEVLSDGSEPRINLTPAIKPGAEQKLVLSLGLRSQVPLTIDTAVAFTVEKPKDGKKAGEGADKKDSAEVGAAAFSVIGKVTSATVAQQAGVPEELSSAIAKLKGSRLLFSIGPDSAPSGFSYELAKGADKGIESALSALNETLSSLLAPVPQKPVGVGAYWMVTDRASSSGSEMVRYRVFRLVSLEKDEARLSIELRQYAADTSVRVAAGPQGEVMLALDRFDSRGKGEVGFLPSRFLPTRGEIVTQTQAVIIPPNQPTQRGQVQTEVRLKISP